MRYFYLFISVLFIAQEGIAQSLNWTSTTPDVYSFSSPRVADISDDLVWDIVVGAGVEGETSTYGVVAISGSTGDELWHVEARDQIFGSPIFQDVSGDNIPDVFIGGRGAEFMAINGMSGDVIWDYFPEGDTEDPADYGLYNFYTPQWIEDMDDDGFLDIIITNGGDKSVPSFDTIRPPGQLMVISSLTGDLLASLEAPDGREIYCSPLAHDFFQDGNTRIIFGTGGETISGGLWTIPLSDLMNEDASGFVEIVSNEDKGYIAPPSLADLNGDNVLEIIVNSYDGKITAYDMVTQSNLWQVEVPNGETNASPSIGYYNSDGVPDVFCNYGIGVAPVFSEFKQLMVNGATGEIEWEMSLGLSQFGSPISIDWDENGDHEVLMTINNLQDGGGFEHELVLIDFDPDNVSTLIGPFSGASPVATPWLGDLKDDGFLDLIYTHNTDDADFVSTDGFDMMHYDLPLAVKEVDWGAYLGTNYDGVFMNAFSNCANSDFDITTNITHNVCMGDTNGYAEVISSGCPDPSLCIYEWSCDSTGYSISNMPAGVYTVTITHLDGCVRVAEVEITEPELSIVPTHVTCKGDNNGYAEIVGLDPDRTYTFDWSNGEFVYFIHGLFAGPYSVTVEDDLGCIDFLEVEILEPEESLALTHDFADVSCHGEADGGALFIASGGTEPYTYWIEDVLQENGPLISNLDTGEYVLKVEDVNECFRLDTLVISQPDSLILTSVVTQISCFGEEDGVIASNFTGGTEPYLITWQGLFGDPTYANNYYRPNLEADTYILEIEDENGCYVSDTNTIVEPDELILMLSSEPESWAGAGDGSAMVEIEGGVPPYTLEWNTDPVQTTLSINDLSSQTYTLLVTDSTGCERPGVVFVDLASGMENLNQLGVTVHFDSSAEQLVISSNELLRNGVLSILDLNGRILVRRALSESVQFSIPLQALSAQMFLVRIESQEGVGVKKIIRY